MAGPSTVSIQWIPEDDLLLKNSVEAGASLESLAKGAVQFSRRYTLRELQDRWYSLLYDPDISAQASDHIFELEISGISPACKLNRPENNFSGNKDVSLKRKSESIRRKYYAMRKKIRSEFFSNSDLGFGFQHQVMHDGNPLGQDHLRLKEEDLDILRHAFPATNVSQNGCPNPFEDNQQNGIMRGYGFDENVSSSLKGGNNNLEANINNRNNPLNPDGFSSLQTIVFASEQPRVHHWRTMVDASASSIPVTTMSLQDTALVAEDMISNDVDGKETSSTMYSGEFGDPDSLLNLSNEDGILLVDEDEKHDDDDDDNKSCVNDIDSVPDDLKKESEENDIAEVELGTVTVLEACADPTASENPVVPEVAASFGVPSKSTSISDPVEHRDGEIRCTLNTEDPEIPCNDDIFLLIHPSTSFGSSATQPNTGMSMNVSAENDNDEAITFPTKAKDSTRDLVWPPKVGIHGLPESRSLVGRAAKTEIHDSRPQALLHGFVNKNIGDSSKGRSLYATPKSCSNSLAEKEVSGLDIKVGANPETMSEIQSTEAGSVRTPIPESVVNDSVSDQEESQIDDDVPYFSDIEAMILEMDLDPHDQDSHIIRQGNLSVPRYQYDESKRTIIRLEQGAHSCLQRAMTSQGALAILYGRHLRHYIRKPEVLLGRSTDDFFVDIDLRKEGRANKISRRQAIIKMEADGSFFLKNLGKSSVSVNGIAVATGQLLNLSSGCLIEIKGMSFVFEINQGYVRNHLGTFCLENKGKTSKPEWTPDEE